MADDRSHTLRNRKRAASDDQNRTVRNKKPAMAGDPFSKLPDEIHHRILNLISGKDIVRSSAVSKSWLRLRQSFPFSILHFSLNDFGSISPDDPKSKTEQFIRFVHRSLNSGEQRIKSFSLVTDEETDDDAPDLIRRALDNHIEDLTVESMNDARLPSRVFSAESIKTLNLIGNFSVSIMKNRVNLSSLTVLALDSFEIGNRRLHKLLHGCPILKDLSLCYCHRLSDIYISDNPNLENLQFRYHRSTDSRSRVRVRVSAPKLKQLLYHYDGDYDHPSRNSSLQVMGSPNLKSLDIKYPEMTDNLFHKLLTQFPSLESLTLHCGDCLERIRISNPLLKSIRILNPYDNDILEDVVIDCKNLSFFEISRRKLPIQPNRPLIRMDNPPYFCVARFSVRINEANPPYLQLKEFLAGKPMIRHLGLDIFCSIAYSFMGTTHKQLPCSACEIEELSLCVSSFSSSILNGVLSACHPTTIKFEVNPEDLSPIKLICEEFAKKKRNCECWCKGDFKCWKHQLKNVKVEKIQDIEIDTGVLDWDILDSLLPILRENNFIFFRLWW